MVILFGTVNFIRRTDSRDYVNKQSDISLIRVTDSHKELRTHRCKPNGQYGDNREPVSSPTCGKPRQPLSCVCSWRRWMLCRSNFRLRDTAVKKKTASFWTLSIWWGSGRGVWTDSKSCEALFSKIEFSDSISIYSV